MESAKNAVPLVRPETCVVPPRTFRKSVAETFQKPYFIMAFATTCACFLPFPVLMVYGMAYIYVLDFLALPVCTSAILTPLFAIALAACKGELREFWNFNDEWGNAPVAEESEKTIESYAVTDSKGGNSRVTNEKEEEDLISFEDEEMVESEKSAEFCATHGNTTGSQAINDEEEKDLISFEDEGASKDSTVEDERNESN